MEILHFSVPRKFYCEFLYVKISDAFYTSEIFLFHNQTKFILYCCEEADCVPPSLPSSLSNFVPCAQFVHAPALHTITRNLFGPKAKQTGSRSIESCADKTLEINPKGSTLWAR